MKVVIIGAGSSGLFLAGLLNNNVDVTLFEKNETMGRKLLLTGNGRCNVTNLKSPQEFLSNVVTNPKFLNSAINNFTPNEMYELLTQNNVELVQEDENKIYPKSGKAKTILEFFVNRINSNVKFLTNTTVLNVEKTENGYLVVTSENKEFFDKVIIATGGMSYPITGSTGDGYEFAKNLNHTVIKTRQSLCGFLSNSEVLKPCGGVSFNCNASIVDSNNNVYCTDFGAIMITNFGVSGPLAFKLSSKFLEMCPKDKFMSIDFAYNITKLQLLKQMDEFVVKNPKLEIFEFITPFLIKRFAQTLKTLNEPLLTTKCAELSKTKREQVVNLLKSYKIELLGFDSFDRSIVTRGGVDIKEVNPKTMESKINDGLYFLGEVLDVDALTGGYSLQIAFSTAFSCANHINSLII